MELLFENIKIVPEKICQNKIGKRENNYSHSHTVCVVCVKWRKKYRDGAETV